MVVKCQMSNFSARSCCSQ